jgi:NAD-dependent DNA ligase
MEYKSKFTNSDFALAHRYLYYVENNPIISDYEYDMLEKKAVIECAKSPQHLIHQPGSSLASSYPKRIINLAKKLAKWNPDVNKA